MTSSLTQPDATEASVALRPGEFKRVALAFAAFFLLLSSYYILRPVREDMGVRTGVDKLQWLFTGTFIATIVFVPIFGWVVKRITRPRLVPVVYGIFIANLLIFLALFAFSDSLGVAASFFIWLSVYNLAVVSLFWSNVSDVFSTGEAKRLYGYISAGGTAGALAGPALTASIAHLVSTSTLIGISALLLLASGACSVALRRLSHPSEDTAPRPIGGSLLAGVSRTLQSPTLRGLAFLIIFYTTVTTVIYVEMAAVVRGTFADSGERTVFFATIDLIVNCLALLTQVLGTNRVVMRYGLRTALAVVPLIVMIGLTINGLWTSVIALAVLQIVHRAGEYALVRPGREMIYTRVDPESRYKAKSFIDTTVYRANDAAASWLIATIRAAGVSAFFAVGIPAALLWLFTGFTIGRRHDRTEPA
jgi:AAA family ATP:ADP antiporter